MRKEFIYNLIIVIGANLLVKPLYIFGIDRTIQNLVGPVEYGLYFALFNFALLFQIVTDVGLQNFNNRSISQNPTLVHNYFPAILLLKTGLALLFLGIVYIGANLIGYQGVSLEMLLWIALNTLLVSFILYLRTNISGLGKYKLDSILSILDKVLMILIIGYMIFSVEAISIMDFIQGQTIALVISALIIGALLINHVKPINWPRTFTFPIDLLKKSAPYALVVLLMTLYTRIDAVMIERLLPDGSLQAGIYASGYRFFDAANMIGFLVAGLLLPMFSRMVAQKEDLFPLYRLSLHLVWIVSIYIAVVCYVFRVELVELLYTHADAYWGEVLGCLMLSYVFMMIGYVTGPLLNANGNIYKLNWIFTLSIALNIGLNFVLIAQFKAYGAALATLFTQGFVVLIQIFYVNKTSQFAFYAYPIRHMFFYALLAILGLVSLKSLASFWIFQLAGIFLIGLLSLTYIIYVYRLETRGEAINFERD